MDMDQYDFDDSVLADLMPMDLNVDDSDDEDEELDSDINDLFSDNPVNQGYYVAMYLQRIIGRGELNVPEQPLYRAKLPKIAQSPALKKLKVNPIYQRVQQASGQMLQPPSAVARRSGAAAASSSFTPAAACTLASAPSTLRMVTERERGTGSKHASFTTSQRCGITNTYTPNSYESLMKLDAKVYCGAMSADGAYFVTASQDHVLRVFDARRGLYERINRIAARDVQWSILDIAFTSKGDQFAYATWSSCLQITSVTGESKDIESLNLQPHTPRFCTFSTAFSACDRHIIGGCSDGCLYVYDRHNQERTLRVPVAFNGRGILEEKTDVNTVGFLDESSNIIYTGLDNGAIRIWDRRTMDDTRYEPVSYFIGHVDGVTHIDSKMDGRYLISNSKDQSIKLWDMRSCGRLSQERIAIRTRQTSRGKLSWDYRWDEVPSEFYSTPVSLSSRSDNSIMTYRGHRVRKSLLRAKFSPLETTGQRYIYTGSSTGHLIVYDLLTGAIVQSIDGHKDVTRDVAWHPHRPEILTSSWDGYVNLNTFRDANVEGEPRPTKRAKRSDSGDDEPAERYRDPVYQGAVQRYGYLNQIPLRFGLGIQRRHAVIVIPDQIPRRRRQSQRPVRHVQRSLRQNQASMRQNEPSGFRDQPPGYRNQPPVFRNESPVFRNQPSGYLEQSSMLPYEPTLRRSQRIANQQRGPLIDEFVD